jgi:hypothetical protein
MCDDLVTIQLYSADLISVADFGTVSLFKENKYHIIVRPICSSVRAVCNILYGVVFFCVLIVTSTSILTEQHLEPYPSSLG